MFNTAGINVSPMLWVCALNCLQNSIILIPCGPSAGPTGGAGFAFPAGITSLTCAITSFLAIYILLCFFHLREGQFNRCLPPEYAYQNTHPSMVHINFIHIADKIAERAVDDSYVFALLILTLYHRGRSFFDLLKYNLDLFFRKRDRPGPPYKACDTGSILNEMPRIVIKLHFHKNVPRIKLPVGLLLLFPFEFDNFFSWYQYSGNFFLKRFQLGFLFYGNLYLFFVA